MEDLRVLVIDDELGMRMGVERALRNFRIPVPESEGEDVGIAVFSAESAEEGLETIDAENPGILLLDHKLPGMSGLDLLERIQDRTEEMLVIMITAYASIDTAVTATKRGAYDFLAKPFTPNELKAVVKKAGGRLILARQARELAAEKRRVRFEFIRVLGHELKAPIGAVEGYVNLLKSHALGDDLGKYDQMIERSQLRLEGMRKLIADLLDMTRLESGQMKQDVQDLDLRQVAEMCLEGQAPAAAERHIDLQLHAPPSLPFRADRTQMEMVFNNLVSNAVKYNRPEGRVDLTLEPEGDSVRIEVADTGIGMSAAEVDKLFGEFVRIKNEKTRDVLGSGLGLSILKRIIGLYRGEVRVSSEPDVGTTFTVRLRSAG